MLRNKLYDACMVIRNEAILVEKGYHQLEGIEYDETDALVQYSTHKNVKLHQMDSKSD